MAVTRTVLPNGTVQPQHGSAYETDVDANWALLDQNMGGRSIGDFGLNGVASGFTLSTRPTLTPGLAAGVLYAQGIRLAMPLGANPGAAPASATSYLFYNSTSGFYYSSSPVGTNAGDALIGQVVTSGSAVTAVAQATSLFGQIAATPSAPGNFTLQHFLGRTPIGAIVRMTSGGAIWFQSPTDMDGTNVYLVASAASVTAKVLLW